MCGKGIEAPEAPVGCVYWKSDTLHSVEGSHLAVILLLGPGCVRIFIHDFEPQVKLLMHVVVALPPGTPCLPSIEMSFILCTVVPGEGKCFFHS